MHEYEERNCLFFVYFRSGHINEVCFANPSAVVAHPTNCGQYFDCTKVSTMFGHYLMECPYPQLFDETSRMCKPFNQVHCGSKREPQAPCMYLLTYLILFAHFWA